MAMFTMIMIVEMQKMILTRMKNAETSFVLDRLWMKIALLATPFTTFPKKSNAKKSPSKPEWNHLCRV